MQKKVAFIVQNFLRDLPGIILTALYLSTKGIKSYLVPAQLQKSELFKLCPDLVLLGNCMSQDEKFHKNLADCEIILGLLDSDFTVHQNTKYKEFSRLNKKIPEISFYCLWGEFTREQLGDFNVFDEHKLFITGTPRYDEYADIWKEVTISKITKSKQKYNFSDPYILFCTSFGLVNQASWVEDPDSVMKIHSQTSNISIEVLREYREKQKNDLQTIVNLANELSLKYPNVSFIIRPHIAENINTYFKLKSSADNLFVIRESEVLPWIHHAIATIQSNCYTCLESSISAIPAIQPTWIDNYAQHGYRYVPHLDKFSIKAQTKESFMLIIDDIITNKNVKELNNKENIEYINAYNDGWSHKRIGDIVLHHLSKSNQASNKQIKRRCRQFAYEIGLGASKKEKIYRSLLYSLHIPYNWSFKKMRNIIVASKWDHWDTSDRFFNEVYIKELFSYLKPVFEKNHNVNLEKVKIIDSNKNDDYHFGYLEGRSVTIE